MEPLALSAADGMNACIFAYGQTGSGKTHTMIGDAKGGEMAGVSYRTMNKLFQVLELRRRQQVCAMCSCPLFDSPAYSPVVRGVALDERLDGFLYISMSRVKRESGVCRKPRPGRRRWQLVL